MKVFFSCTTFQFDQYRKYYFSIRDYIVECGNVITHDWLSSLRNTSSKKIPDIGTGEYKRAVKGVEEADVLVFESTLSSFSTGHLLTLGVQMKKPVLVMWLDSSSWVGRRSFIESLEQENVELTSYNLSNYQTKLSAFFNKYHKYGTKHRFNLVLDDSEWQYIEWLNYRAFKTRSKIIREMVREKMKGDEEYSKYLSGRHA